MMISCILFDLDGVLVDACDWHYEALNMALLQISGEGAVIQPNEHQTTFNGLPTRQKLWLLEQQQRIVHDDFERIWTAKQDYTISTIKDRAHLDHGKVSMLSGLQKSGYRLACVTNSIRSTAQLMLELTGQLNYFDFIITNEDVHRSKPDPEGYNLAMQQFNVAPSETLVIEDSDKGYKAAFESGAHVLRIKDAAELTTDIIYERIKMI